VRQYCGLSILRMSLQERWREIFFFTRACSDRRKGNGFKLKAGRFRLDIRKKFFTMSVARHRNRLPREVVDAPSLEMFEFRLDAASRNLV